MAKSGWTLHISPKSVVASGSGHLIAQNMMYRHSIAVYNRSYRLVKTISDRVDLQDLGGPAADGPVRGAPVEAAFSPDARYAYVSNYSMYGPSYTREGSDRCSPGSAIDPSFLYRVDMGRLAVDRVGQVGQVPKYVAATPDGRLVLVSNEQLVLLICERGCSSTETKRSWLVLRWGLGVADRAGVKVEWPERGGDADLDAGEGRHRMQQRRGSLSHRLGITSSRAA